MADDGSCGGPLPFGAVVACAEVVGGATDVYTVTTTVDGERLAGRVSGGTRAVSARLTQSDGTPICSFYHFAQQPDCVVPKAGAHQLTIVTTASSTPVSQYLVSVDSRTHPSLCVALPAAAFTLASPGRDDTMRTGSVGTCYEFDQPTGANVRIVATAPDGIAELPGEVRNAAGKAICQTAASRTCVLSGAGPYRLFVANELPGGTNSFHLATARMSEPHGCAELPVAPFGGPGDRFGSLTVARDALACLTFPAVAGPYVIATGDDQLLWLLLDASGKELRCAQSALGELCLIPKAGRYTVVVHGPTAARQSGDFRAALYPLAGTDGCSPTVATNTPVTVSMTSRMQVDCHLIDADPDDRVTVSSAAGGWITNASGARLCGFGQAECVLSGAGPYRILSTGTWDDRTGGGSYDFRAKLLGDASGCPGVAPGRYGDDPAGATSTNPCRLLTVPGPGRYLVELVDDKNNRGKGTVSDGAGNRICDTGWCTFPAAGRYRLTVTGSAAHATVFLPEAGGPATGCEPVSDAPTGAGHTFLFYAGQYDCLNLPTPAGTGLMLFTRAQPVPTPAIVSIQDSAGRSTCDVRELLDQTCILRGTAPFRAVIGGPDGGADPSAEKFTFVRSGGAPACPELTAGTFAAPAATDATFDHDHLLRCFSVPALHAAAEIVSVEPFVVGRARVSVFGESGRRACRSDAENGHFALCRLEPGAATIFVEASSPYDRVAVARRDATGAAAGCQQVGTTAVGSPSLTGTVRSGADVHCYKVPAGAADRLMIGTRDTNSASRTLVLDPVGGDAGCTAATRTCSVTGKTGYQVFVSAMERLRYTTYQLDAWKVWTADGPARECTTIPSLAYGFGPYTGTLNAATPASCLVTARRPGDALTLSVTNPATASDGFRDGVYAVTADGVQACTMGADAGRFTCPPANDPVEPTIFLLTSGERVTPHPYRWEATCTAPLCGDNRFTVTAVEPATLVGGATRSLTIRGTSFHLNDRVRITAVGSDPLTAQVTSISADRTLLTAEVDLGSVPAGTMFVEVKAFGAGVGQAVLADALTITEPVMMATKAPAITGKAVVGAAVTASTGVWAPPATSYTYQWASNGTAIKGATARTYVIPAAQLGKRLTVRVTASRDGAVPGTAASAQTAAVAKGAAPKASKKPTIRGSAKVGRTVTASAGTWSPGPDSYRYEWRINGKVVKGATNTSLKLTSSMRNKKLTLTVIAVKKGYADGKAVSATVTVKK